MELQTRLQPINATTSIQSQDQVESILKAYY